jgi:hypothetical protein
VQSRDVLLNITGASVARCCIAPNDVLPARVNQHVAIIRTIADTLDPEFLHFALISTPYKDQLLGIGEDGGSTRQAITKAQIQNFSVAYPAKLSEQREIVTKLDAVLVETHRLESLYQKKLDALDALKKSLLHQAFSGLLSREVIPVVIETKPATPSHAVIDGISTTDLHAGVLAIACEQHEIAGKIGDFTHVKGEKCSHMIEALLGIDLGRTPVKDAAGPNDFNHLKKVEHRAKMINAFDFKRVEGGAYRVTKLHGFDRLIAKTRAALGDRLSEVEKLIRWMLPMSVRQAEIVATVYAGWNNLLLDGKRPTDEEIVYESRENWHPDKLKIDRGKFFTAIEWMRGQNVVPEGKGKRVVAKGK